MGYKSFQICVDSPTGSYYAGSNLTGRVVVVLEKPKKVRGLRIKFEGGAKVSWTENESVRQNDGNTRNENVTYSADEEYFSIKYFLVGSESSKLMVSIVKIVNQSSTYEIILNAMDKIGVLLALKNTSGEIEIPAGENVYPFSTTLPPRLPTSFDGEHGHVRYSITATLDRPWKIDEETKLIFTVVTPTDLNFLPQVKEPAKKEASKTFCCLCCKSGPLTLAASIPFSGYVPGQTILATIEVDNASNVHISCVKCKLRKELKWIVKSPVQKEKIDVVDIVKFELEEVAPNGSKSWSQKIEIPHMPFVNLDACSIIKVEFYILITACPSGAHTDLELKFPITLGTVPLYQIGGGGPVAPDGPAPLYPVLQPMVPKAPGGETPLPVGFVTPTGPPLS